MFILLRTARTAKPPFDFTIIFHWSVISHCWGRCRSCGERISPRYFFVELLMACLAVALYYQFGFSLAFLVSFIFVAALIVISFIDLDVRIVPDVISLPGIVAGLLFSVVARYCHQ